jgi:hypothetical protein
MNMPPPTRSATRRITLGAHAKHGNDNGSGRTNRAQRTDDPETLRKLIAQYEEVFGEVAHFITLIARQEIEISERQQAVYAAKEKYDTAKDQLSESRESRDGTKHALFMFLKPGPAEILPLFDRMEPAQEEKHGKHSERVAQGSDQRIATVARGHQPAHRCRRDLRRAAPGSRAGEANGLVERDRRNYRSDGGGDRRPAERLHCGTHEMNMLANRSNLPQGLTLEKPARNLAALATTDALTELQRVVLKQWRHKETFARLAKHGIRPVDRLLFFGPPGNGKTMASQWIAQQIDAPLYRVRCESIDSAPLGRNCRRHWGGYDLAGKARPVRCPT